MSQDHASLFIASKNIIHVKNKLIPNIKYYIAQNYHCKTGLSKKKFVTSYLSEFLSTMKKIKKRKDKLYDNSMSQEEIDDEEFNPEDAIEDLRGKKGRPVKYYEAEERFKNVIILQKRNDFLLDELRDMMN